MKIIFNDATELQIQQAVLHGDYLLFKTVSATPEELRKLFEDPVKTKKMTVEERGQTVAVYEGYTTFYSTTEYIGQIYGVTMYKPDKTPEAQEEKQEAAIIVAKIQAVQNRKVSYIRRSFIQSNPKPYIPIRLDTRHSFQSICQGAYGSVWRSIAVGAATEYKPI